MGAFDASAIVGFLLLVETELLLFASVFFLLGAIDEVGVDLAWLWLRLTRKVATRSVNRREYRKKPLRGPAAVMVAAWQESEVIGAMVAHTRAAWPQEAMHLYVGCYGNDPHTVGAALNAAAGDPRVSIIILPHSGPTTKADCLNHIYASLIEDERLANRPYHMVVMHDAEDMVDPAALALMDEALVDADYVQLPVLPLPQPRSRWIGSHYCEEFAEAHGKAMVMRQAMGVSVPAAGVGCAFRRTMLHRLVPDADFGPFSVESLTEDYELGMRIREARGKAAFVRARGDDGRLVATRAWFPSDLTAAVRQKARWMHGIAFQAWDRLGWSGNAIEFWMRLRDRRGPLNALVIMAGYGVLLVSAILGVLRLLSLAPPLSIGPWLKGLLLANLVCFCWRIVARFSFTAREYGWREGGTALMRIPVSNVIAIMAARRALRDYLRSLAGGPVNWDKTHHAAHPAFNGTAQVAERPLPPAVFEHAANGPVTAGFAE